ncbi:hypothetical protein [Legionella norrlandica]
MSSILTSKPVFPHYELGEGLDKIRDKIVQLDG